MALKDLSGKSVHDLDREDFEQLFCVHCLEYQNCPRDGLKIAGCKDFVDTGLWDTFYRKRYDVEMTTE